MGLIKKLIERLIKHKIVLVDRFTSSISHEEIRKYKEAAQITNPANYSKKIIPELTTDEVVNLGIQHMKKDGFKIATEEVVKGL